MYTLYIGDSIPKWTHRKVRTLVSCSMLIKWWTVQPVMAWRSLRIGLYKPVPLFILTLQINSDSVDSKWITKLYVLHFILFLTLTAVILPYLLCICSKSQQWHKLPADFNLDTIFSYCPAYVHFIHCFKLEKNYQKLLHDTGNYSFKKARIFTYTYPMLTYRRRLSNF
jgi:hypothetical protein